MEKNTKQTRTACISCGKLSTDLNEITGKCLDCEEREIEQQVKTTNAMYGDLLSVLKLFMV